MQTSRAVFLAGGACLLITILFWNRPSQAERTSSCPDAALGESPLDCPWAGISRKLSKAAHEGKRLNLKTEAPEIYAELVQDSKHPGLRRLWGESLNFDELAKATIVDPAILRALAEAFGTPWISERIVNAALEHTYGYLFSTLKTPFGFKRARWVSGEVERGFGIPEGLLSPNAPHSGGGTLFQNVTYFFSRIAFRDDSIRLNELEKDRAQVASAIRDFDYQQLKPVRVEEIIPAAKILLHTDLVPFLKDPTKYLLVYSVVTQGVPKIITGFPVTEKFAHSLLDSDRLGEHKQMTPLYNAYVEGISGKIVTGTRRTLSVDYIDTRRRK